MWLLKGTRIQSKNIYLNYCPYVYINFSVHTPLRRAEVCNTAVKNPVGKVKADSQKTMGGRAVVAHFSNWSTLATKSLVHEAKGFIEG